MRFLGSNSIEGCCVISIDRTAKVIIGNKFRLVSSSLFNPLCRTRAIVCVSKGAELVIGDNVGMSSPVIWVRQSIKIGNNVNLGGVFC